MWQMLRTLKYFAPKYVNVLRLTIVRQSTNQVTNQALSLPFCTCPAWVFPMWQTMSSKERFPRGALQKELAACQGLREEAALSELPAGGSSSSSWVEPGGKWQAAPYTWPTHLYLRKHPLAGTAGLSHFRVPSHHAASSQEHFFRTASCQVLSSTQSLTAPPLPPGPQIRALQPALMHSQERHQHCYSGYSSTWQLSAFSRISKEWGTKQPHGRTAATKQLHAAAHSWTHTATVGSSVSTETPNPTNSPRRTKSKSREGLEKRETGTESNNRQKGQAGRK